MKSDVAAVSALIGICVCVVFVPLAAQEATVRYGADLAYSKNCPSLGNGANIRVDVQGGELTGSWGRNTRNQFEGKLNGSKFVIVQPYARGSEQRISGSVETDSIKLTLEFSTCRINVVLKKI